MDSPSPTGTEVGTVPDGSGPGYLARCDSATEEESLPSAGEIATIDRWRRRVWAFLLIYGVVGLFVIDRFIVGMTVMRSGSMAPALRADGEVVDVVCVDRVTHRWRQPHRYEIVHFKDQDDVWVLKRVMGLPGETIEIKDGRVLIDQNPLTDNASVSRIHYTNTGHLGSDRKIRIGDDHYFLLGDDSEDSYDSRFWGAIHRDRILGIARAVVWPPSRVASLTPGD